MNNSCKFLTFIFVLIFFSCTDKKEPFFDARYVYKNMLQNNVSIEFYRKNRDKLNLTIIDSISIPQDSEGYAFGPEYNDSIILKFNGNKKLVFKSQDNNSQNWPYNATNSSAYKVSELISGNLTTSIYTYTIDAKIYDLAK